MQCQEKNREKWGRGSFQHRGRRRWDASQTMGAAPRCSSCGGCAGPHVSPSGRHGTAGAASARAGPQAAWPGFPPCAPHPPRRLRRPAGAPPAGAPRQHQTRGAPAAPGQAAKVSGKAGAAEGACWRQGFGDSAVAAAAAAGQAVAGQRRLLNTTTKISALPTHLDAQHVGPHSKHFHGAALRGGQQRGAGRHLQHLQLSQGGGWAVWLGAGGRGCGCTAARATQC